MHTSTAHPAAPSPSRIARWTRCGPALACAFAALGGCAVAPLPALRPDVPAAWQHTPPAASGAAAPDLRAWWNAFHDAELDRLVDAAIAANLTLAQAVLRIESARAIAGSAHAGFQPQIGAHTYSEPTPDSSASYFQAGFDARWELGLFGRSQSQQRSTAADLGIAESEAQAARVSVVAEVARAYVELRGAQRRLALLQGLAHGADRNATLTATRERLHLATAGEVARAQSGQATAQAALAEPRLAIERSRQQLGVLLGRSEPPAGLVRAGPPPELGDLRIASAPADLLRTRPEIRRAENQVLKAAGDLGLARADLYPRLGLGGALTYASKVIGHSRLSDADGIVTFGPVIDIPLFDWGARRAVADARDVDLAASVLAYRQAVLDGVAETEIAMAAFDQQGTRVAALDRGLAGLERSDASAATLLRLGLADRFERIAAQSALLQARLERAQATQDRSIAFITLYKALGGAPLPDREALPPGGPDAAAGRAAAPPAADRAGIVRGAGPTAERPR
jgi:NodT family efflux transporter outer membrane factor (OMF) lipoprotein